MGTLKKLRENCLRGLFPGEEIPEAQAGGRLGACFLFPKGSGKSLRPSPKQAPLTRKLRPPSLARDQGTLQAVGRCLPKPVACRQEWEVSGGFSSRADAASLLHCWRCSLPPGTALGAPGAGGRERDWLRAQAWGPLFPSQVSRLAGPRPRRRLQLWNAVPSRRRRGVTTWTSASKARSPPLSQVPRKRGERQLVDWEGCATRRTPLGGEGVRSSRPEGARRGGVALRATAPA